MNGREDEYDQRRDHKRTATTKPTHTYSFSLQPNSFSIFISFHFFFIPNLHHKNVQVTFYLFDRLKIIII